MAISEMLNRQTMSRPQSISHRLSLGRGMRGNVQVWSKQPQTAEAEVYTFIDPRNMPQRKQIEPVAANTI